MIIATSGDEVRFITQPDHAALAGQFAQYWAPNSRTGIEPAASVMIAAFHHDVGWERYDRQPRLDNTGQLIDFRDTPPEPWIRLYERGIEEVIELDPYAGLLVSLHGTGLRRQRYGLSPNWPETPPEFSAFVDTQEARQAELAREMQDASRISRTDIDVLAELHASGRAPPSTDSQLWRNYQRLQAWDTLSLAFCTSLTPPSYERIDSIPPGDLAGSEALSVTARSDGAFALDPYPFETAPVSVTVPSRTIAKTNVLDTETLRESYYRSTRELESFTLRRPN